MQTYVCLANLRPLIGFWQGVARCGFYGGTRSRNLLLYSIMRSGPVGKADNCGCREMSEVVGLADPWRIFARRDPLVIKEVMHPVLVVECCVLRCELWANVLVQNLLSGLLFSKLRQEYLPVPP